MVAVLLRVSIPGNLEIKLLSEGGLCLAQRDPESLAVPERPSYLALPGQLAQLGMEDASLQLSAVVGWILKPGARTWWVGSDSRTNSAWAPSSFSRAFSSSSRRPGFAWSCPKSPDCFFQTGPAASFGNKSRLPGLKAFRRTDPLPAVFD